MFFLLRTLPAFRTSTLLFALLLSLSMVSPTSAKTQETAEQWSQLAVAQRWGDKELSLLKDWLSNSDEQGKERILKRASEMVFGAPSDQVQNSRAEVFASLLEACGKSKEATALLENTFYSLAGAGNLKEAEKLIHVFDSKPPVDKAEGYATLSVAAAQLGKKDESLHYWILKDQIHPAFNVRLLRANYCAYGMTPVLLNYYSNKPVKNPKDKASGASEDLYERYRLLAIDMLEFEQLLEWGNLRAAEQRTLLLPTTTLTEKVLKAERLARIAFLHARSGDKDRCMSVWKEKHQVSPEYYSWTDFELMANKYAMKEQLLAFYKPQESNKDEQWYKGLMLLLASPK